MSAVPQTWSHTEPRIGALAETILQGYRRAESEDWQSGTDGERIRAWYGLWIETAYCMAELAGTVEKGHTIKIDPGVSPAVAPDRRRAAVVLYQTAFLLMVEHERSGALETRAESDEPKDTGAAPLVAAALLAAGVVVAVAQTAAIAYVATKGLELVNQELARRADLRLLVKTHGAALQIVREHVQRETELGRQIPLDPAEKTVLDGLNQAQREIAKKQAQPLAPELERMGSALSSAARWAPWILGGALVAYLVFTHRKDKS